MLNKVLLTPVDELVDYVKEHKNCSVSDIKEHLKVNTETIEKWLVVLEENKVLKIKYKGFEGYVEYAEKESAEEQQLLDVERMKDLFVRKCRDKDMSYEKIKKIWPLFVDEHEEELRKNFEKKGKKMGYDKSKIEKAWLKYKSDLVRM